MANPTTQIILQSLATGVLSVSDTRNSSTDKTEQCTECISDLSFSSSFVTDPTRRVQFDLESTTYHKSGRDLSSEDERKACWYDGKALAKAEQDVLRQSKQLATTRSFLKRRAKSFDQGWRKAFLQFHCCCLSVKSEGGVAAGFSEDNRKNVLSIYSCTKPIWGLERYLLRSMRGSDGRSRAALILECADRQVGPSSSAEEKERIFQRISSAVSRPSRVFAREIAEAQFSSLQKIG